MVQAAFPLHCASCPRPGRSGRTVRTGRGFTLIEMMVVVAVMVIVGMALTVSFSGTVAGYRIAGAANSLSRDLQYARAEALKRGQPVSVCASSDGASCSGSTSWQTGWIVFYDANGNGAVDTSGGDVVLRAETQNPGKNTLSADNSVSAVTFNRQGSIAGLPANPVTFTLHEPTGSASLTRCVALVPSGRALIQNAGQGNCS